MTRYPPHVKEAALRLYRRYDLKGHIIARMLKVDLDITIKPKRIYTWIAAANPKKANRKAQQQAARPASGSSTAARSAATAKNGATSAKPGLSA